MFLLLLVAHLSTKSNSVQGHTPNPRASADSCDDINSCRRLFDIVWGCLATIFACTWVSVHLNVPSPNQGRLSRLGRRLWMMLVAVIAPELMVAFAARQLCAARFFAKEFDLSLAHGFFISMGGFVSRHGHHPIATMRQLEDTPEYLVDMRHLEAEDIMDRSKGDALSKGVALAQGLWFATQCLARVDQHLPVTEIEVATLGFAVLNIFIWLLWWHKPLDVDRAVPIGPIEDVGEVPLVPRPWYLYLLREILIGDYTHYNPTSSTALPLFWAMECDHAAFDAIITVSHTTEGLVGTIFGAIYCAAWNASFPSIFEMWLWRSSSVAVAIIPAIMVLIPGWRFLCNNLLRIIAPGLWKSYWVGWRSETLDTLAWSVIIVFSPIYILARLFLIVLQLTTLRALPPGAYIDVDWTAFIPTLA